MAVKKLEMIDDLLAPRDTLIIKFQGKNPFTASAMAGSVIKSIMKIPSKDLLETDVRWDSAGENRDFYGKWMGKRSEDAWSKTWIRIIIQGSQHAKEKTGWVRIELKGSLRTSFNYANFIQRSLWWFYNYSFYYKQRRKLLEAGKDDIYDIKEAFQRALGIAPQ